MNKALVKNSAIYISETCRCQRHMEMYVYTLYAYAKDGLTNSWRTVWCDLKVWFGQKLNHVSINLFDFNCIKMVVPSLASQNIGIFFL